MLRSYLKLAWKVLWRRKFFTAISLFGICLTLVVLMVATAVLDHIFAPMAPEVRQDRTLGVFRARMIGERRRSRACPATCCSTATRATCPASSAWRSSACRRRSTRIRAASASSRCIKRTDAEYWRVLDFRVPRRRAVHRPGRRQRRRWSPSSTPPRATGSSAARRPSARRSKPTASTSASSASCPTCRSCGSWPTATSTRRSRRRRPTPTGGS